MSKLTIKVHEMKSRKEIWPDVQIDRLVDYKPFCDAVEEFLNKDHRVHIGVSSRTGDPLGHVHTYVPYSGPSQVVVTVKEGDQLRLFDDLVTDMKEFGYTVASKERAYFGGEMEVRL